MAKLKELLNELAFENEKVNKHEVIEGVRGYSIIGRSLHDNNVLDIAEQLIHIAESAHTHVLSETDDWFDKVTVNKNMKTLKSSVVEFQKTANEAHVTNQRLTALYEDIGHVLNRYYDISEDLSEADGGDMDNDGKDEPDDEEYMDNKDKAIKNAMKNEDKGDMDNDGKDEPDDEEYMDNKDKAIKKAVKKENKSLKDIGGIVDIPTLGQFIPNNIKKR